MSLQRHPPASCSSFGALVLREAAVEAGEPRGDRGDRVGVAGAERDLVEQLLERDGRLAVERRRCRRARVSVTPTASTITNRSFACGVGGDRLEGRSSSMTRTPRPFICSKYVRLLTERMKNTHSSGLHVGAGRDHVDGHGDARVVRVAERRDQLVGLPAGRLVGDLGGEVVALAEHLAGDLDDLVGVRVVLGEDQRLRHLACGRGRSR